MKAPPPQIRVGGEIDAFCSRCSLNLAHTIIAMVGPKVVKVQCNTCDSTHQYRGEQPHTKAQSFANPRRSAARTTPRASAVTVTWDEQLRAKDLSKAKRYSPKDTYAADDLIEHPTFGLGLVTAVRGDKVDIAFKGMDKTLAHGKGEAAVARPTFHGPKGSGGISDKPPSELDGAPPKDDSGSSGAEEADPS